MSPPQTPGLSLVQKSVVVFSKNYLPMARVNLKRAAVLLVTGQAESLPLDHSRCWQLRSPGLILTVPEQIRLIHTNPERHWKVPPVNRREVLKRDNHTCQYCGSRSALTLDHVLPRSKGGPHSWQNVVTACESCNGKKGDRTPTQAGMVLKTKPKAPAHPAVLFAEQFWQQNSCFTA
ncbi:HNH endonuclease [Prochlorothrix hollandica]|uniref:HNH nuclease n=1 Tax=Prochlorothrix hollandica PCC 9006 = CALU 1027 TaxID=317619 RepID=A0A0M2PXD2_PROHO|nr:HNH endonuclease [Prochlorothrix hollandica]KKJ01096.1 HNH nuclease [Prochlorothrix hollandica PCC 9006 = CALU 1027]